MPCGIAVLFPVANLVAMTLIRGKVREAKGIPGSCVSDFFNVCCCPLCSLIQEAQEVEGMEPPPAAAEMAMARE